MRGFTFSYPTAQAAQLGRIAIAVANSFEPFPAGAGGGAAGSSASAPPPGPVLTATALVIAPGRALTALKADACTNPTVAGKPVRFERTDAASGLAIISGDLGAKGEAPRVGALAHDLVVLGFADNGISASSASLAGDEARPLVMAAAGGDPAFDRRGALVGFVAPTGEEPKRVAGVALAAPHSLIGPDALRAFLGEGVAAPPDGASLSSGEIAEQAKGALVAVFCQR